MAWNLRAVSRGLRLVDPAAVDRRGEGRAGAHDRYGQEGHGGVLRQPGLPVAIRYELRARGTGRRVRAGAGRTAPWTLDLGLLLPQVTLRHVGSRQDGPGRHPPRIQLRPARTGSGRRVSNPDR